MVLCCAVLCCAVERRREGGERERGEREERGRGEGGEEQERREKERGNVGLLGGRERGRQDGSGGVVVLVLVLGCLGDVRFWVVDGMWQ